MGTARVILSAPTVARLTVEGGPTVKVMAGQAALVKVASEGPQGPRGLPGADADVPDPGDLTIYFQNGLT